jgi:hypothetical protein
MDCKHNLFNVINKILSTVVDWGYHQGGRSSEVPPLGIQTLAVPKQGFDSISLMAVMEGLTLCSLQSLKTCG